MKGTASPRSAARPLPVVGVGVCRSRTDAPRFDRDTRLVRRVGGSHNASHRTRVLPQDGCRAGHRGAGASGKSKERQEPMCLAIPGRILEITGEHEARG
jgi:hypothetical protein